MGWVKKIKEKVAYEKESFRMGEAELAAILKDHPELLKKKKRKQ